MSEEKVKYRNKKCALTKLNYIRKNSNRKKLPVRVYQEDGQWLLTKLELSSEVTLTELIGDIINYGHSKMYSRGGISEEERRLLNKLKKSFCDF